MVRSISLFGRLLGELPRGDFERLVTPHEAGRYAKTERVNESETESIRI
jgi:hypothetical protein